MKKETEELLEKLVSQLEGKTDFSEVRDALFKRGVEALLKAEMSAHLGYPQGAAPSADNKRNGYSEKTIKSSNGEHRIKIPRDRKGDFEPVIVPKHQSMTEELEACTLALYAKGMSNADIIDFVGQTYGVTYSTSQVSIITNQLLDLD